MVSRCCKANLYIETGEENHYCCVRCRMHCKVVAAEHTEEDKNDRDGETSK